jgi:hypothetical protein
MEELLQEVVDEENIELRIQLTEKTLQLTEQTLLLENVEQDKDKLREQTLLTQFPDNVQCIYYGLIDNIGMKKEQLIKFGCSNYLIDRVKSHKKTYKNFRLIAAFRVQNKTHIETAIKEHVILRTLQRNLKINKINHIELLTTTGTSIDEIDSIIREIITKIEYSPENFSFICEENEKLKIEVREHLCKIVENDKIKDENETLKRELVLFKEKIIEENEKKVKVFLKLDKEKNILHNKLMDFQNKNQKISSTPLQSNVVARIYKQPDGLYYIDGIYYEILYGTRQEVWDGVAYKTSGGLIKAKLCIGANGFVVSKLKRETASKENRLKAYMDKNKIE